MTLDEFFPNGHSNGRKFTKHGWTSNEYFEPFFRTNDGTWYGLNELGSRFYTDGSSDFREWYPPKTKKKVTLYRAIFKTSNGEYVTDSSWSDRKSYTCSRVSIESGPPILYEEREIEVDE